MFFLSLFFAILALVWSMTIAPEGSSRSADMLPALAAWLAALWFLVLSLVPRGSNAKNSDRTDRQKRERKKTLSGETDRPEDHRSEMARFQWHFCDWLVLLFAAAMLVSFFHFLSVELGNIRYALSSLGAWFVSIFAWFYIRSLRCVPNGKTITAVLLTVIFAAAVAESLYGIYAYTVRDPAIRRAYLKDPDAMLKAEGFNYPEGSQERILLEKRLLSSSEPLGTYGLTNTLGGVLTPWLVVLTGLFAWSVLLWTRRSKKSKVGGSFRNQLCADSGFVNDLEKKTEISFALLYKIIGATVICALPISICLLLTKSRSAVLAVIFGIAFLLFLYMILIRRRFPQSGRRSFLVIASFFVSVLILSVLASVLAFMTGILDREVFTEAGKSLGYRLEYWTSTVAMIRDYPLFGVGAGNFQTIYPHYILPYSSEVIADPHNFVFEIAALFGIPALIFFLIWIGAVLCSVFKIKNMEETDDQNLPEVNGSKPVRQIGTNSPGSAVRQDGIYSPECGSADRSLPCKAILISVVAAGILTFIGSFFSTAPVDLFYLLLFWIVFALVGSALYYFSRPFGGSTLPEIRKEVKRSSGAREGMDNITERPIRFPCKIVSFGEREMFFDLFLVSAVVSVLVNLGAAGGIAYPSVVSAVWIAAAVMINRSQDARKNHQISSADQNGSSQTGRTPLYLSAVLLPILWLFVVFGGYLPSVKGNWSVGRYQTDNTLAAELQMDHLKSPEVFCSEDQYSIELAKVYYSGMLGFYAQSFQSVLNQTGGNFSIALMNETGNEYKVLYEKARTHLKKIAPNSASVRNYLCESEWISYQQCRAPTLLNNALADAEEMVFWFPTDAKKYFLRGQILNELKRKNDAKKSFQEALRLDRLTPHEDRKLSSDQRKFAENF